MPNTDRAKSRIVDTDWITQMKGLAMLFIIIFHWFSHNLTGIFKAIFNAGAQGNHVFFILSAFGLYLSLSKRAADPGSRSGWYAWFMQRARKILIPYYVSVIIVFTSIVLNGAAYRNLSETCARMGLNTGTVFSTVLLYRNFVDSHSTAINTPWWFAITILQLYALFPFLCRALQKWGGRRLLFAAFLINMIYIILYSVVLKTTNNSFACFPLQWLFSFTLGLVLCESYLRNGQEVLDRLYGWKPVVAGVIFEGVGVALASYGDTGKAFNDLLFGAGIFLLTFNLARYLSMFDVTRRISMVIGRYSLALFLLHTPYIYLLFPKRTSLGLVGGVWQLVEYAIFLTFLTWVSTKLFFDRIGTVGGSNANGR